jgi:hypothetical protein
MYVHKVKLSTESQRPLWVPFLLEVHWIVLQHISCDRYLELLEETSTSLPSWTALPKWLDVYPIPDQTAEACVAKLLDEYIGRFGYPLALHSEQGSNFGSDVFHQLCQLMEIRKSRTSVRNPKGNECIERSYRTLLQMIRAYLKGEQNDWDLHLGCLTSAYRSSENESTGLTPNMLMLGREVRTPFELLFGCRAEVFVSYGDYVAGLRVRLQVAHGNLSAILGKNC